jgi:hypothetical protein
VAVLWLPSLQPSGRWLCEVKQEIQMLDSVESEELPVVHEWNMMQGTRGGGFSTIRTTKEEEPIHI